MMIGVHVEVLLIAGYVLFLLAVAAGLELLARGSHRRSEQLQVVGFRYHPEPDAWECPEGQRLGRFEIDHKEHVVRYRAPSHVCNACTCKPDCTDSDDGRLIERPLDSWFRSEIRRFHRGISLALLALATVILLVEILHFDHARDQIILAGLLAPIGVFEVRLASGLWARSGR
jgi:hypothetical protein